MLRPVHRQVADGLALEDIGSKDSYQGIASAMPYSQQNKCAF
jgi:hypothetical protein